MASIGFDIYGTLIDPYYVGEELKKSIGEKSEEFKNLWRDKQLEYSFRQTAMQKFSHFSNCTKMALIYCDKYLKTNLKDSDFNRLLDLYTRLPCYDDVTSTLKNLLSGGHELFAFSNGDYEDLVSLLNHSELIDYFHGIISADEVRKFKPAPEIYELFKQRANPGKESWLVSANSFDIIGAGACGIKTIWLKRDSEAVFDPFGYEPDHIIDTFETLNQVFI